MELHIVTEANRCLNCKKPMCQQGCPIHTPIPKAISLFKAGQMMEAGRPVRDPVCPGQEDLRQLQ